jgi:hypothetical protein
VQNCSPLATRLKPSTAKWAADRFKKGHQASNPASTRALLQHRALRFLETALLILYCSNGLRFRAWWQSPLSSSSNASAPDLRLIVENHVQQGTVDFDAAVVVNKTQFPKFVHEKAHARSCRADHLRQGLLADLRNDWLRLTFLAKIRQK